MPNDAEAEREARRLADMEEEADMYAANCQFGRASSIMKQVNRGRAALLGLSKATCPNVLRDAIQRGDHREESSD